MRRSIMAALAAFAVAIGGALIWNGESGRLGSAHEAKDGGADGAALVQSVESSGADAGVSHEDLVLAIFDAAPMLREGEEFSLGSSLPAGSPKAVRLGVILVQYRGAELAQPTTRPRQEALFMARSIAELAKTDFKGQLAKGDPGSMEDAGRFPRGVLEPAAEFTVFTMHPGDVSDPIDTPRGFWIVRRIE